MNGRCARCGGQIAEARGRRTGHDRFIKDPAGPLIKTKCVQCGRFFGYRYVENRYAARQARAEASGQHGSGDGDVSGLRAGPDETDGELDLLV